eukprot:Selendium_serpulae@DN7574_c0_g1_i1.p1
MTYPEGADLYRPLNIQSLLGGSEARPDSVGLDCCAVIWYMTPVHLALQEMKQICLICLLCLVFSSSVLQCHCGSGFNVVGSGTNSVFVWGRNDRGQIGNMTASGFAHQPLPMANNMMGCGTSSRGGGGEAAGLVAPFGGGGLRPGGGMITLTPLYKDRILAISVGPDFVVATVAQRNAHLYLWGSFRTLEGPPEMPSQQTGGKAGPGGLAGLKGAGLGGGLMKKPGGLDAAKGGAAPSPKPLTLPLIQRYNIRRPVPITHKCWMGANLTDVCCGPSRVVVSQVSLQKQLLCRWVSV